MIWYIIKRNNIPYIEKERVWKILRNIFKNKENQLRSGWKIVITFATIFIVTIIISGTIGIAYLFKLMDSSGGNLDPVELETMVNSNELLNKGLSVLQTIITILGVLLFWKIFDKKPIKDLGLTNPFKSIRKLTSGLVFGIISISLVFFVLLLSGQIQVTNKFLEPNFTKWIIIDLFFFILVGINEEFFARGYCMTVLKQTKNKWLILLLPALIFASMHLGNPNTNYLGIANIFLVGILFALMFLKSGNLWMPIGYHITWNYFQGNVYGMNVSGLDIHGIYSTKVLSPNFINGGAFGPEGGLIATVVIILGIIYMVKFYQQNEEKVVVGTANI
jgi:membrane protease YdiL (CAAX protease family)